MAHHRQRDGRRSERGSGARIARNLALSGVRALVTGADGFVGAHLVHHLESIGDEVIAAVGPGGAGGGERAIDVQDADAVLALVHDVRPDAIFHLAAVATQGSPIGDAMSRAIGVTVAGTANVLAAARQSDPLPVVHIPSSAAVYGIPEGGAALTEEDRLRPASVYGAIKASQEMLAHAFHQSGMVPVVITRSFNHIGRGQRTSGALPSFASRLAEIALGRAEPILAVGNVNVERDFSDVRDAVAVFRRLVQVRATGPVNVCSGTAQSLQEMLATLISLSGLTVELRVDPARLRSVDPQRVVGDTSRLIAAIGASPPPSTRDTLADIWRDAIERAQADAPGPGIRR
jgi:GDP-4-dehydro-6-deoxy-D-mannose reductase